MKYILFEVKIFVCSLLIAAVALASIPHQKNKDMAKVQTYTQRTYPEGYCSDGIAKFYIGPQRLTIVHYHNQSDNAYGTFCYTGRWAGEYFIARQKDTIAQVTMDSALVFPRCCPLKYRK